MVGRAPAEAVQAFLDPLQHAVSCLTREVLSVQGGYHPADHPHLLALARNRPVRLSGARRLSLAIQQRYRIVEHPGVGETWRVVTVGYAYAVHDTAGLELLAYHWHPGEPNNALGIVTGPDP